MSLDETPSIRRAIVNRHFAAEIIDRVRNGHPEAERELHRMMRPGVELLIRHRLACHPTREQVRDIVSAVVQAIRSGEVSNPDQSAALARKLALERGTPYRPEKAENRRGEARQTALCVENCQLMKRILIALSRREREILTRFYTSGESIDQICESMSIASEDLRRLRSRARARFDESLAGRRRKRLATSSGMPEEADGGTSLRPKSDGLRTRSRPSAYAPPSADRRNKAG
jgi:DNA-directed RNA polymerase specialized sigma subunit